MLLLQALSKNQLGFSAASFLPAMNPNLRVPHGYFQLGSPTPQADTEWDRNRDRERERERERERGWERERRDNLRRDDVSVNSRMDRYVSGGHDRLPDHNRYAPPAPAPPRDRYTSVPERDRIQRTVVADRYIPSGPPPRPPVDRYTSNIHPKSDRYIPAPVAPRGGLDHYEPSLAVEKKVDRYSSKLSRAMPGDPYKELFVDHYDGTKPVDARIANTNRDQKVDHYQPANATKPPKSRVSAVDHYESNWRQSKREQRTTGSNKSPTDQENVEILASPVQTPDSPGQTPDQTDI